MTDPIHTAAEAMEASALPRAHAVHADPATEGVESAPLPAAVRQPVASKSPAEWAYQRLVLYIRKFEEGLDGEHEVAMGFVGGAPGVLKIQGMGYFDPDIVTFYGTDPTGQKTQLIQHVSQLSVFLRAVPKAPERPEPQRIGFRLAADLETADLKSADPNDAAP
ncbi:hypothetical protein EKE94_10150 [Mesobaculum littorinae]|uniref:Uncharacterized protein n=1 Tax=Mesobaculum littorinae TaxID=2486419 RepID=A0A438AGY4_9RHOB|nr:DUF6173 family protein [Mesobaculum littorinae]RVV97837.1 hypothetical protein EKE94_10150 [Mesobaculum littorinae]